MIFVPKKEDCLVWNDCGDYLNIYYRPNKDSDESIDFKWWKKDNKYEDPNYLEVSEVNNCLVLPCSLDACRCNPQLRYNKIIDKWYCNCTSSALGTKNDDQDEIDTLLQYAKGEYTEEKGFFDNPYHAIMFWNIGQAEDFKRINQIMMTTKDEDTSPYFQMLIEKGK